ncbi:hypothetical protein [Arcanobacterium hippocoleae]|uniref:Uncharacterized protein n=1 Tax=Arcanobacterium hippocoleae TaxID=149017 RepID=A0ABU1T2S0_9ACTO|nr:hypothetical protein [Arcanobacterium hippocoleae]MDR6939545.1 hypothetical protein [Arcanobacterium hippocoleae]
MYGFIWRHLPGPTWLKFIEALIMIVGIVAFLFFYGFPWISENTNLGSVTVD